MFSINLLYLSGVIFPVVLTSSTKSVVVVSTANWETSSVLSDIVINGKTNINTAANPIAITVISVSLI